MSNELCLRGNTWIAADIHLGPNSPKTAACFYQFLLKAEQNCDQLLLCGDIFNAWIGDELAQQPPPWLADAMQSMRHFSHQRPLYLMRGNRDFLLGHDFAYAVGAQLLPDQIIIHQGKLRFLLTHGDELCTDDQAYQRFRKLVRAPWVQKLFYQLPLTSRQKLANFFRQRSKKSGQYKPMSITDVSPLSCQQLLYANQLRLLIHGHTHRPAIHSLDQTKNTYRVVIPDWECEHSEPSRFGWVSILNNTLHLHENDRIQTLELSRMLEP